MRGSASDNLVEAGRMEPYICDVCENAQHYRATALGRLALELDTLARKEGIVL